MQRLWHLSQSLVYLFSHKPTMTCVFAMKLFKHQKGPHKRAHKSQLLIDVAWSVPQTLLHLLITLQALDPSTLFTWGCCLWASLEHPCFLITFILCPLRILAKCRQVVWPRTSHLFECQFPLPYLSNKYLLSTSTNISGTIPHLNSCVTFVFETFW
jgi:hypothetical protein